MPPLPDRADGNVIDMSWFNDIKGVLNGSGTFADDTLQYPVIGPTPPTDPRGRLSRTGTNKLRMSTGSGSTKVYVSESLQLARVKGQLIYVNGVNQITVLGRPSARRTLQFNPTTNTPEWADTVSTIRRVTQAQYDALTPQSGVIYLVRPN